MRYSARTAASVSEATSRSGDQNEHCFWLIGRPERMAPKQHPHGRANDTQLFDQHRGGGDPVAHRVASSIDFALDHAIGCQWERTGSAYTEATTGVTLVLHVGCTAAARAGRAGCVASSKRRREAGGGLGSGSDHRRARHEPGLQPGPGVESSTPGSPCRCRSSTEACSKATTAGLWQCSHGRKRGRRAGRDQRGRLAL